MDTVSSPSGKPGINSGKMVEPSFFIVGTVKGGTTSLYNYLAGHPSIYMSPIKEPHFFCTDIDPAKFREQYRKMVQVDIDAFLQTDLTDRSINAAFIRDWNKYLQLFRNAKSNQVAGESSTSYMISTVAAKNIQERLPQSKIIIMLRDPVKRAYSHYLMNYKSGSSTGTFRSEIDEDMKATPKGWGLTRLYVDHGFYYEQVKRYLDAFGKDQVKIILMDDFAANTEAIVKDTFRFLNVDDTYRSDVGEKHNEAVVPKSSFSRFLMKQRALIGVASNLLPRPIKRAIYDNLLTSKKFPDFDADTQRMLRNIYKDDIVRLQTLINRDLSNWLK